MTENILQSLLTTLSVDVHHFAVCEIEEGWRLSKRGSLDALLIHYVLTGTGTIQLDDDAPTRFGPNSIVVPPRGRRHTIGFADAACTAEAEDARDVLPSGVLRLVAGGGSADMLLACGAISASHAGALGLFEGLRDPVVEDLSATAHLRHAFAFMVEELAHPGLGTPEVTGAVMKQCLLMFLRMHLARRGVGSPIFGALRDPRLATAVAAVVDAPAAPHTVEGLAALCGMSRTAFAERFSETYGEGPIAFLQRVRLRLAAQMLTASPLPVKVIAANVGYASRSSFTHAFKAAYGVDPTTFRDRLAATGRHAEPVEGAVFDAQ